MFFNGSDTLFGTVSFLLYKSVTPMVIIVSIFSIKNYCINFTRIL